MDNRSCKNFKTLIVVVGILLFIQYWLGMVINLFVTIPKSDPLNFLNYSGGIEVLAHISNGVLIFIISCLIVYYSIRLTNSIFSKLSIVGIIFVLSAIISGLVFILGGMDNPFSIAMAMIFISIYSLYFYEFYLIDKSEGDHS